MEGLTHFVPYAGDGPQRQGRHEGSCLAGE